MSTNVYSAAVVNYAPVKGAVELREIARPEIGEYDVLLEVANVGVCGSDLHQWTADHSWSVNYPVVLGHEFGGVIVETGKSVAHWKLGDRVVSETAAIINPDNPLTKAGFYNLDPDRKGFGYGVNGAMTKWVKVPERCLHRIPETPHQGRRARNFLDRRSWLGSSREKSQRFRANAGREIALVLFASLFTGPQPRRVGMEASKSGHRRPHGGDQQGRL